jgi:hypothetical protein
MSEGIAAYLSGQHRVESIKTGLCDANKKVCEIFEVNTSEEFANCGGYIFSYTVIEYIIHVYGEAKLQEYFLSQDFAPFEILNVEPNQFIDGWKNFLRETYIADSIIKCDECHT